MLAQAVIIPTSPPGGGPSATPGGASLTYASGGPAPQDINVVWSNGDITASTEIGQFTALGVFVSVLHEAAPAVTSWGPVAVNGWIISDPGQALTPIKIGVRHKKNGITTSWVMTADYATEDYPE